MAIYKCLTDNPLNEELRWDVTAWGTVCESEVKSIKIEDEMTTVLHFKMLEDNGQANHCFVFGKKGMNIAPYATKGARVRIGGKAKSKTPHVITVLAIEVEEE